MANFAVVGAGGFVAPRHLAAIRDTGHTLVAAADPHDAVGVLDRYSYSAHYFPDTERFWSHVQTVNATPSADRVHVVSICTPNDLHAAHARRALLAGAAVICEKPLVLDPRQLDELESLERQTGLLIHTVMQLRLHPAIKALEGTLPQGRRHDVVVTYVAPRGRWHDASWKGDQARSGGLLINIGIHLFDLLLFLFGRALDCRVHLSAPRRASGRCVLESADVRWFLSTDPLDLELVNRSGHATRRCLSIDGVLVDLSQGFEDLHTLAYRDILSGRGLGIADARPALALTHRLQRSTTDAATDGHHPFLPLIPDLP